MILRRGFRGKSNACIYRYDLDGIAWRFLKSSMHITSDNVRHRLHVRRNEYVLSFFHTLMYLSACCILLSNETQAHVKIGDGTQSRSQSQHRILVFTCLTAIVRALHITKAEAAPPRHPLPTLKSRASEPDQRHQHPGVSSFTVTSHHRPLTRGSRGFGQTRILENARPSGERNERGFPSSLRNLSDERLESGWLRMTGLRNGYWLVNVDGLGGDRAAGTGKACL